MFFAVIAMLFFAGCAKNSIAEPKSPTDTLCFAEKICIKIERATTPKQQAQGLMFRESLSENSGMLFLFPDQKPRSFWMKNTLIPLDLVWIDESKTIVGITENVQPCAGDPCRAYPSNLPVKYVLEINSGSSEKFGIRQGQKIDFLD